MDIFEWAVCTVSKYYCIKQKHIILGMKKSKMFTCKQTIINNEIQGGPLNSASHTTMDIRKIDKAKNIRMMMFCGMHSTCSNEIQFSLKDRIR